MVAASQPRIQETETKLASILGKPIKIEIDLQTILTDPQENSDLEKLTEQQVSINTGSVSVCQHLSFYVIYVIHSCLFLEMSTSFFTNEFSWNFLRKLK